MAAINELSPEGDSVRAQIGGIDFNDDDPDSRAFHIAAAQREAAASRIFATDAIASLGPDRYDGERFPTREAHDIAVRIVPMAAIAVGTYVAYKVAKKLF